MYIHACMLSCFSCVQLYVTLWTIAHQAPLPIRIPQNKNTRAGCHVLLQGISSTEGSNPRLFCLLHWYISSLPYHHLGRLNIYTYMCVCVCVCIYKSTILQLKIKRIKSHDIKTLLDNVGHILTTGCLYLLGF